MIDLQSIDYAIEVQNEKLKQLEFCNRRKAELGAYAGRVKEHYDEINDKIDTMNQVYTVCLREANEYKESRLDMLIKQAESVLALAFPNENFRVRFDFTMYGKESHVQLKIGHEHDPEDKWLSPVTANGGCVKQLLSASIVASICVLNHVDYLFLDEFFCSSDPVVVSKVGQFIESLSSLGLQLVLIEHKPNLYGDIERRDILLRKDHSRREVELVSNEQITTELFEEEMTKIEELLREGLKDVRETIIEESPEADKAPISLDYDYDDYNYEHQDRYKDFDNEDDY